MTRDTSHVTRDTWVARAAVLLRLAVSPVVGGGVGVAAAAGIFVTLDRGVIAAHDTPHLTRHNDCRQCPRTPVAC